MDIQYIHFYLSILLVLIKVFVFYFLPIRGKNSYKYVFIGSLKRNNRSQCQEAAQSSSSKGSCTTIISNNSWLFIPCAIGLSLAYIWTAAVFIARAICISWAFTCSSWIFRFINGALLISWSSTDCHKHHGCGKNELHIDLFNYILKLIE